MAIVSRNVPPCAAVVTIRPASGGPSSTTSHSSGEKAALVVMTCSCAPRGCGHVKNLATPGRALHPARVRYPGHGRLRSGQVLAEDARFELARACTQHAWLAAHIASRPARQFL